MGKDGVLVKMKSPRMLNVRERKNMFSNSPKMEKQDLAILTIPGQSLNSPTLFAASYTMERQATPPLCWLAYWDFNSERLIAANRLFLDAFNVTLGSKWDNLFIGPDDLPFLQNTLDHSRKAVDKCVVDLISSSEVRSVVVETTIVVYLVTKYGTLILVELTIGIEDYTPSESLHPAAHRCVSWRINPSNPSPYSRPRFTQINFVNMYQQQPLHSAPSTNTQSHHFTPSRHQKRSDSMSGST